jgi:hypothetical protein
MLARNLSIHLKSNLLSEDVRTVETDTLLTLHKQNGIRKLIVGGMLLGLLPGMCFAQRAPQHSTPSATAAPNAPTAAPNAATAAPNAPTAAPNAPTAAPNAPTAAPNAPTAAPNAPSLAPSDTIQNPPIPSDTGVNPDAAPSTLQP